MLTAPHFIVSSQWLSWRDRHNTLVEGRDHSLPKLLSYFLSHASRMRICQFYSWRLREPSVSLQHQYPCSLPHIKATSGFLNWPLGMGLGVVVEHETGRLSGLCLSGVFFKVLSAFTFCSMVPATWNRPKFHQIAGPTKFSISTTTT